MIGRGSLVATRHRQVLVEDLEGEEFIVPHPTRGFAFICCGEVTPVLGPRALVQLEDGRDLLLAQDVLVATPSGLIRAGTLTPGVRLWGTLPAIVEAVTLDEGSTCRIEGLSGVLFGVNSITVMG